MRRVASLISYSLSFVVIFSSLGTGARISPLSAMPLLALQQLENLGLVKTLPRFKAFEYSEMFVTWRLCFVSRSLSMISGSMLFWVPLCVVLLSCCLWSASLYCWLYHMWETFLAVTSKTDGSRASMMGLLVAADWFMTACDSEVI